MLADGIEAKWIDAFCGEGRRGAGCVWVVAIRAVHGLIESAGIPDQRNL